jgi:hypothetical protein
VHPPLRARFLFNNDGQKTNNDGQKIKRQPNTEKQAEPGKWGVYFRLFYSRLTKDYQGPERPSSVIRAISVRS